jgi:hypothetical protein
MPMGELPRGPGGDRLMLRVHRNRRPPPGPLDSVVLLTLVSRKRKTETT